MLAQRGAARIRRAYLGVELGEQVLDQEEHEVEAAHHRTVVARRAPVGIASSVGAP